MACLAAYAVDLTLLLSWCSQRYSLCLQGSLCWNVPASCEEGLVKDKDDSMIAHSVRWGIRPLVVCLAIWMVGLLLDAFFCISLVVWFSVIGFGFILLVACYWYNQPGWSIGLLLVWLALGGAWYAMERYQLHQKMGASLASWTHRKIWVEGWVLGPVHRVQRRSQPTMQYVVFRLIRGTRSLLSSGQKSRRLPWHKLHGQIWLKLRGGQQLSRGDWLRVHLRLRRPRMYANPGGFDSYRYWSQRGIRWHASVRAQHVIRLGQSVQGYWLRQGDKLRARIIAWIRTSLDSTDAAGLLCALLLGNKSGITNTMRQHFARTGTAHMLAISGLHLAIVCSLLWLGLRWLLALSSFLLVRGLHHTFASCLTLPGAAAYVWLSGAALSTQRALVMLFLFFLGGLLRRSRDSLTTLVVTAFLILLWQPMALFTLSFQLSFGAVIALIWGHRLWMGSGQDTSHTRQPMLQRVGRWLMLSMGASAIATLATLPLTLQFFPQLPLWGPVVNLLAVPLGGYLVVGGGLLAVALWFVSPFLAGPVLWLSGYCAELLLLWVKWCAHWPGAQLSFFPLQLHEWVVYYLLLGFVLFWWKQRHLAMSLLVSAVLVWTGTWLQRQIMHRPALEIHFLDVGQGDTALIRFPHGKVMLVDAGGAVFGRWDVGERVLLPALRALRISHIDYAVLTHPHPDHYGGFVAVVKHLSVGEFWHTGLRSRHPKFQRLMKLLQQRKIKQRLFSLQHRRLSVDGVKIEVLHPFPGPYEGKHYYWVLHANNNSLVLRLTWGRFRFLMTGDVEHRAEQILLQRWPDIQADVLKVPHHGSRTSSTAAFLDRVRPKHALFGVGRDNMFGFPHPSVLRRYRKRKIRMWRTDLHGRILLRTDGTNLTIEPFLR